MASRSGSILIYVIGLSAIVVIIASAFLHSMVAESRSAEHHEAMALAQSAARQGLNEALEALIADHIATNLAVGTGPGTSAVLAVPTHIDGPWHAPFVSRRQPYSVDQVDYQGSDSEIDASNEHLVLQPLLSVGSNDYVKWYGLGLSIYDGRGRHVEPNFHNLSRPAPVNGNPAVAPVDFTDLNAALPERSGGLWLDAAWCRMQTGDPRTDRSTARYRLRYALGVVDLDSLLLSNPLSDPDLDHNDPANDYRQPEPWVAGAQHAWYNLVSMFAPPPRYTDQANVVAGMRAEHVFLGRGLASNVDRGPGTGMPVTFPMMFRRHAGQANTDDQFWGYYGLGWNFPSDECEGLYRNAGTPASAAGLVPLAPIVANGDANMPFISTLFGPQLSWRNHFQATAGWSPWNYDGISGNHTIGRREQMLLTTPYGRGLRASAAPPADWGPGDAHVDTPWHVNLLTAPPTVLNAMIWAYLPPTVKTLKYTRESYQFHTGQNAFGNNTWGPSQGTNVIPEQDRSIHGRDLFTRLSGNGFQRYEPPQTPGVVPDFQIYGSITGGQKPTGVRAELRGAGERYPGRLWNGDPAHAGEGGDDLGEHIDVDTRFLQHGLCSHTRRALLDDLGGSITFWKENADPKGTPPAGWGSNPLDAFTWTVDPDVYKFDASYWWDILKAFSTAAAFTRAQWVQYPSDAFRPDTGFSPSGLRDPASYDTIAEFDALFLRQLGENLAAPGTVGSMQPAYVQDALWNGKDQRWTLGPAANHNIRSLLDADLLATPTVTSLERSKVMELVLNDFRMSFFGSSPAYATGFRPLDFNGDGKVTCSAYDPNLAATPDEIANGTATWKTVADAAAIDHWFSLTGCFFIGRSRHFRVITRGEVWDNLMRTTVAGVTLESVVFLNPDNAGMNRTHIPFQRWHFNRYTGNLPLLED